MMQKRHNQEWLIAVNPDTHIKEEILPRLKLHVASNTEKMMRKTTQQGMWLIAVNPDTQDFQDILHVHVASNTEHLRIGVLS